jgi:hypothetical protein
MGPVNAYLTYGIDAALEQVPPDCAWIRGQQEKFERLRGQKAVLVLGMCLLEDIVSIMIISRSKTEQLSRTHYSRLWNNIRV